MVFSKISQTKFLWLALSAVTLVSFQNCMPVRFSQVLTSEQASLKFCSEQPGALECQPIPPPICRFNGKEYKQGDRIMTYLTSSPPYGGSCKSEFRVCDSGAFSGTYSYATCNVGAPAACLFNGRTIKHNETISVYINSTVAFGQLCSSLKRTCTNGTLSGTGNFESCIPGAPANCRFNNQTVAHNSSVRAFPTSVVPFGSSCGGQDRLCLNGALGGSGDFASCSITAPRDCRFNGQNVTHGNSVDAFVTGSVSFGQACRSEKRTCNDGTMSGSFAFGSCSVGSANTCTFNGQTLAHGASVDAFSNSSVGFGQSCTSEKRLCTNGSLSGSYGFSTCQVDGASACTFNGQAIAHGASVTAYNTNSVLFGETCQPQLRTCSNGNLSGTYMNATCVVGPATKCSFNGNEIANGGSVDAFLTASVQFGQTCASEKRVCTNGALSGSYNFGSCQADPPASCTLNGQTIAHGGYVDVYQAPSVSFGQSCASERRTCLNGQLSGSFTFQSCAPESPGSCVFNGQPIAHGGQVEAFSSSSVGFGNSCQSQIRVCANGQLSGDYGYGNCRVEDPKPCLLNGVVVPHGGQVPAFETGTVPFGGSCRGETRVCNNEQLSGSFTFSSCDPGQPSACRINNREFAHGESLVFFERTEVAYNEECQSQNRLCTNGTANGSFDQNSCEKRKLFEKALSLSSFNTNAPFKLLLVIDNSFSMSPSQEKIAAKLDSLLLPLKGRNVDVKLISTSDAVDIQGKVFNTRTGAEIGTTNAYYGFDQTPYVDLAEPIHVKYEAVEKDVQLFKLLSTDNDQQLAGQISAIKTAIKALGVNGSDTEKSFCPIARQLYDVSSNAFFKQNDKAAIVVLSDEEDSSFIPGTDPSSAYSQCFKAYQDFYLKPESTTYPGYSQTTYQGKYSYDVKVAVVSFNYTLVTPGNYRDGIYEPGSEFPNQQGGGYLTGATNFKDEPTGNCNATLLSVAQNSMGSFASGGSRDHVLTGCEVKIIRYEETLYYENAVPTENLCGGGVYTGTSSYSSYWAGSSLKAIFESKYNPQWSNMAYAGTACQFEPKAVTDEGPSTTYTYRTLEKRNYDKLIPVTTSEQFIEQIFAKAQAVFSSSYFMTYIVHLNQPDSQNYPGQSKGSKYIQAAATHPNNAEAVSILSSDFGAALTKISEFITKNLVTEYDMQLPAGSVVVEVWVRSSGGSLRQMQASEYTLNGNRIQLKVNLQLDDQLVVKYTN